MAVVNNVQRISRFNIHLKLKQEAFNFFLFSHESKEYDLIVVISVSGFTTTLHSMLYTYLPVSGKG